MRLFAFWQDPSDSAQPASQVLGNYEGREHPASFFINPSHPIKRKQGPKTHVQQVLELEAHLAHILPFHKAKRVPETKRQTTAT